MADVLECAPNYSTTDLTVTLDNETLVITSPRIAVVRSTLAAMILGHVKLTTGASVETVNIRVRRGSTVTGAQIGDTNSEALKALAQSTEPYSIMVLEELAGLADVQYSLTLEQSSASTNGTVRQAAILVLLM